MLKNAKFTVGLTLLVQSASFIILFFMLYKRKKNLAETFLALSAIGGLAGAYLVLKEARKEAEAADAAAKDTDANVFNFDECANCMGDCGSCEAEVSVIPEEEPAKEEAPAEETAEEVPAAEEPAVEEPVEESFDAAEEPAEAPAEQA